MTSVRYKLTELMFRSMVKPMIKKISSDPDTYFEKVREQQKKSSLPLKSLHKKYKFEECSESGTAYYALHSKKGSSGKLVLYFFGGGFTMPGNGGDFEFGQDMADKTGSDVWLVWYPLLPDASAAEIVKAAVNVYSKAVTMYKPENISLFGLSAGAGLSLAVCVHIKEKKMNLPLPKKLVLFSPTVMLPPSEDHQKKMIELAKNDCEFPPEFMNIMIRFPKIAKTEGCDYLFSPSNYSWSGFPPMCVFYGSDEPLSPQLDVIKSKCRSDGVMLETHIGEGMMHCWAAADFLPEAHKARAEIYKFIIANQTNIRTSSTPR